jgi:hypothetical protein
MELNGHGQRRRSANAKDLTISGDNQCPLIANLGDVSRVLGREILPTEHAKVESFAQLNDADVAEMRLLAKASGVLAIKYCRFRLKGSAPLSDASMYCEYVIRQKMTASLPELPVWRNLSVSSNDRTWPI